MVLNLEKTKITHAQMKSANFLKYKIYKTKMSKMPIKIDSKRCLWWIVLRLILDTLVKK